MFISFRALAPLSTALLLSSCATTPERFYEDPQAVGDIHLCRTLLDATDPQFRADLQAEASRRGLAEDSCRKKVTAANVGLGAVAVIGTTAAVAAACSDGGCAGGGGGGYASPNYSADYDCAGGTGNGPYYVQGPVYVGINDPYDLDRDGDGIGCEASDMGWGA